WELLLRQPRARRFFGSIVGWGMWGGLMFASAFYMLGFGQYLTHVRRP
ncbi:hypothetical protein GRX66_18820, partial [Halobacterium sp. PCN9]|nr:hypothetical protein [Halobacterium bonnevillei]